MPKNHFPERKVSVPQHGFVVLSSKGIRSIIKINGFESPRPLCFFFQEFRESCFYIVTTNLRDLLLVFDRITLCQSQKIKCNGDVYICFNLRE